MLPDGLASPLVELAVHNLLIDRLTAEVAGLFAEAGIECMLIKGPVIAEWLYEDGLRGYLDSDLLVARSDWDGAVALLEHHGFSDYLGPMAHPRMESLASTAFVRGTQAVDLHCTLAGLEVAPEMIWGTLWQNADRKEVGGRVMTVPGRPAILMHLALHAAHHGHLKPLEDLRRGIEAADVEDWRAAAMLAEELGGLAAFASGLRLVPEGRTLVRTLGVEDVGSVHFDLRASSVPTAEALNELLGPGLTVTQRAEVALRELFPKPGFMWWWTPLARRGRRGLLVSYPLRWAWLAVKVPGGLLELRRARRRRAGV